MVEDEEVPARRSPCMRGRVPPASIEKSNAPVSKFQIESIVEDVLDNSPMQEEPQNIETHEAESVKKTPQENLEICKSNATDVLEKAPINEQPVIPLVSEYSNVSLIPYKSS